MQVVHVSAPHDPALSAIWNLRDTEVLRERRQFIAEGRLVVGRVLEDPRYVVQALLLNAASKRALEPALERSTFNGTLYVCDAATFETITGFNLHRGCLALVDRPADRPWRDLLDAHGPVVVLDGVTDADNVGAVFRNAAAFGAAAVFLSPTCCDPLYRKALRTSMGAALQVPYARLEPWPEALLHLKECGLSVVALSPREPSVPLGVLKRPDRPKRIAFVVGTEGAGLSSQVEAMADLRVRIPTTSRVDSLNLATAMGIALHVIFGASEPG